MKSNQLSKVFVGSATAAYAAIALATFTETGHKALMPSDAVAVSWDSLEHVLTFEGHGLQCDSIIPAILVLCEPKELETPVIAIMPKHSPRPL